MNERGWITGEYFDQCSPGSFGCCPFLSVCSVVVDSLFIVCMYHCLWGFLGFWSLFGNAVLCVLFSSAIIWLRMRELVTFL